MKVGSRVSHLFLRWLTVSLTGACLTLCTARADVLTFEAYMDPSQEIPPHNTPGYGDATLTLDTTSGFVTNVNGSFSDLLAGATRVSLNDAGYGTNGPTIFTFSLDGSAGLTSGTFGGYGTLTSGQITDMLNSNTYINISDSVYPSGEIRGQLILVPEPSTVALACLGLAGLFVVRRWPAL